MMQDWQSRRRVATFARRRDDTPEEHCAWSAGGRTSAADGGGRSKRAPSVGREPECFSITCRYSEMSPSLIPMITAVIRLLAPSFLMELLRWNSTVFSDMVR